MAGHNVFPEMEEDEDPYFSETLSQAKNLGKGYRVGGNPVPEDFYDSFFTETEHPVPLQAIDPAQLSIGTASEEGVDHPPETPTAQDKPLDADFEEVLERFPAYQRAEKARRASGGHAGSSGSSGRRPSAPVVDVPSEEDGSSSEEERDEEDDGDDAGENQPGSGSDGGDGEDSEDPKGKGKQKKKRASKPPPEDPDDIPSLPTNVGPMPYTQFYHLDGVHFTMEFHKKYNIPEDVVLERVPELGRVTWGDDFTVVPLFAITEGGLRFPFHPLIREFLFEFRIAPCQLMVNTYRILSSAVKLVEENTAITKLLLADLMLMYQVGRNAQYDRYYLFTVTGFDHLISRLYDTEKWANVYVKVSGRFEYGPLDERFESRRRIEGRRLSRTVFPIPRSRQPQMSKSRRRSPISIHV